MLLPSGSICDSVSLLERRDGQKPGKRGDAKDMKAGPNFLANFFRAY